MAIDKEKILDLAQKYVLKGQPKKAIQEYLKLIEVTPKDKRLYLKLGDLYLKEGEKEKAIGEYLKLAELYAEEDLNFRAISVYKRVLSIDPKFVEAFHKIAKLYLKEGLIGSAKSYYQNVLEIKPGDTEARHALEDIEARQKETKEPPKVVVPPPQPRVPESLPPLEKKVVQQKPTPPPAPQIPREVTYESESSAADADKDSQMHYHLGIAYKEMELYDYAISEFEQAASCGPIRFDCYIMLGNCFMEKGDYDQSIKYYTLASKVPGLSNQKLARVHFSLGLAYEAKGMVSEALSTFTTVLKLDHSFSKAQERIKRLQTKTDHS
ncbi:MAG: tetratricopeptide repeat protein [Syntrophaceae bacterium]|nr:tetratricopeptide repeat protein [Syntrophaceae bacterium]